MSKDHDVLVALCRSSYAAFIRKSFALLNQGEVYLDNWHIQAIAWKLQQCVDGELRKLIISIGPRYLKSFCASVVLPIWILGKDPTAKIICISYSEDLALLFSRHRRQLLNDNFIRLLFPKLRVSSAKNTEREIVTTKGGSIYSTSVGGGLTGRGADYIIVDDPMKTDSAQSDAERTTTNNWYFSVVPSRLNNKNKGVIIVVAQRVHHDDLIGNLTEKSSSSWDVLSVPAIAEEDQEYKTGEHEFHYRKSGEPIHKERESISALKEIKADIGSYNFAAQYQQQPVPPEGNIIRWSWFGQFKLGSDWSVFDFVFDSWDTAASVRDGSAYSAVTTWGYSKGKLYLLDCQRFRLPYTNLLKKIRSIAYQNGSNAILVENASTGVSIIPELKQQGLDVIGVTPKGDKLARALNASPRIESGNVLLPKEAPFLAELQAEAAVFPNGKHSDLIDSMTQAINWTKNHKPAKIEAKITRIYDKSVQVVHRDGYFQRTGLHTFNF